MSRPDKRPKPGPAGDPTDTQKTGKACPICGKAATVRDKPFCSVRCANVDLNRWLGGVYAVPAQGGDDGSVGEGEDEAG